MKKIGILTSGGDAPGMNDAVVAVARAAAKHNMPLVGIIRGYNGLLRKKATLSEDLEVLSLERVLDIEGTGGTYIRTARCTEFLNPEVRAKAVETLKEMEIGGLVVVGGDGSYQGAMRLCELGVPCIGIPGTIDNDLAYTEMTLGFDTAVNECVTAVRNIRSTSRSHDRPHVVECMGRHCGDIALNTAAATNAEIVVVPERTWSIEKVAARLSEQLAKGNFRATVIVAEGAWDSMEPFNLDTFAKDNNMPMNMGDTMNAEYLAKVLSKMCKAELRATVLAYIQRGPVPTFRDSKFAFEAGNMAVELLQQGIGNRAIGIKDGRIFNMDFTEALKQKHFFDEKLYNDINTL